MLTAGQKTTNKILTWVKRGRDAIASLLFPPRCPVCDEILEPEETEKGIHLACESKLYPIYGAVCMHCGRPLTERNPRQDQDTIQTEYFYDSTREYCYDCVKKGYVARSTAEACSHIAQGKALYLYKGAIKTTMYRLKYSNKQEYARFFAKQAVEKYGDWMKQRGVDVIVPVPMYLPKQRRRGYNQAESFAKELAELTGIPVDSSQVYRVTDTTPQKALDYNQRKNNLKNAFQKGENVVQYNCAMVVDDIYTTGSTAQAVAQELIKQGTHRVYLLTVCIGGDR